MISEATVQRLPLYLNCFEEIKNSNIEEISVSGAREYY